MIPYYVHHWNWDDDNERSHVVLYVSATKFRNSVYLFENCLNEKNRNFIATKITRGRYTVYTVACPSNYILYL